MRRDWWSEEFRMMVAIGESTTAGGWSTSRSRCWVSLLANLISDYQSQPVELVNVGIGANVISRRSPCYGYASKPAGNERIDEHVMAHHPDLVIVSYGLNDARGGTPVQLFVEELVALIHSVREKSSALIVLLGPYYITDFALGGEGWAHADLHLLHDFNQAIVKVAEQENCLFVDVLAANGETDWMVHYDGVHANDLGHRIIANTVFEILAQNCSCLARHTKELEKTSPRWRDESTLKSEDT
jgi:lysophospholipase L1-like esterase